MSLTNECQFHSSQPWFTRGSQRAIDIRMPAYPDAPRGVFLPEILVMYCQRSAPGVTSGVVEDEACLVRMVAMPCTSKVELTHCLAVLERGTDAVLVVGCPVDTCRFLTGSHMTMKRIERGRDLLGQVGMGAERLSMRLASELDSGALVGLARELARAVKPLGPSPMKGVTPA